MPRTLSPEQKTRYYAERREGASIRAAMAAKGVGISLSSAQKLEKNLKRKNAEEGINPRLLDAENKLPGPKTYKEMGLHARRAYDDFAYFQSYYLGRISQPWQVEAATKIQELLESPTKEYCVVNVAPGSGKTVLFTHDIPAWLTIRNRAIRGLIGSATQSLANRNVARLRRTLERPVLVAPDEALVRQGFAVEPRGVMAHDFGRFKPLERELWTRDAFIVMQMDATSITEKEPTWSAYGMDTGFIGGRYDFVIWDDLVDPRKLRSIEQKELLEQNWTDVAETRLEPAGLLVLQGQRLAADDLYRFALDMKGYDPQIEGEQDLEAPTVTSGSREGMKYHHVVFRAHYEDRCKPENHLKGAPSYPDGCLLSTWRLPWRELKPLIDRRDGRFEVIYQQEDTADSEVLVPKNWIYGDASHYGCLDETRDMLEVPKGLTGLHSYVAIDPSPTQFWGMLWFLYHPQSEQRFVFNLENRKMDASDLLDFNYNDKVFYGIMEEWQKLSCELGVPISHWIVEINAAQRFLLQHDYVRIWQGMRGVEIIPHSTARNKSDPEYGVWTIRHHYEFGRYRLPYKANTEGRAKTMRLVNELVRYPEGRTDDLVMANWFFEWQLPRIWTPARPSTPQSRPTWLANA